jgi:hypothetical protein
MVENTIAKYYDLPKLIATLHWGIMSSRLILSHIMVMGL